MTTRTRISRLQSRIEAVATFMQSGRDVVVVVAGDETTDEALTRYRAQHPEMPPGRVTFICTGVPRGRRHAKQGAGI